jgi:ketosteroid isomerase-like protein
MQAHPVGGDAMNQTAVAIGHNLEHDPGYSEILSIAAEEAAAIESGDAHKYVSLLAPDAVFLPQNESIKAGEELRTWMRDFLERTVIHYLEFRHLETGVRDDVGFHTYTCRWTATPKAGGPPTESSFKGVQILRRQPDGSWKISVSIWNTNPLPARP